MATCPHTGRGSRAGVSRRESERGRQAPQRRLGGAAILEANSAESRATRASAPRLLAKGWREHGIAFYTSRRHQERVSHSHAAGAIGRATTVSSSSRRTRSTDARAAQPPKTSNIWVCVSDPRTRRRRRGRSCIASRTRAASTAGGRRRRFDQVLHQGVRQVWSLTWPGIKQVRASSSRRSTKAARFPNGYIAATHHDADIDRPA